MKKETLALDMGGSAVKAGLFLDGKLAKVDSWRHKYNDSLPADSKAALLSNCITFAGEKVSLVGLAIAGLIATDGSVFESTLMSSFDGVNIGDFLKTGLNASGYSQDNDADCGAVGEFHFTKKKSEMLCVVVGSGIGSAALDSTGKILYPVRVDKSRRDAADMNHPISDVGLVLLQ
jgi:predicted NBD/HSP70 family sugar kinase